VPEPPIGDGRRRSGRGDSDRGARWGGAGGRWLVYLGRFVLWAFIVVILVNGIRAIADRFTGSSTGGTPSTGTTASTPPSASGFPTATAAGYALAFAHVYLNYSSATADQRQSELATFLAPGLDTQLGWNGSGNMTLENATVGAVVPHGTTGATVTILALANGKSFELAVPIYARGGAMSVSGDPAVLPMPAKAQAPSVMPANPDTTLESQLMGPLATFFQAYAGANAGTLHQYAASSVNGLGGTVSLSQIVSIAAPHGPAGSRTVTVTVEWQVPATGARQQPSQLEQTYELNVVRQNRTWFVESIQGAT
jgi:hypothetical protein